MKFVQMLSLLHLAGLAMMFDLTYEKIPNGIVTAGLLCGLAYQFSLAGITGLVSYLAGVFLPLLVFGVFWYFRMIGAGDIKLLAAIGGFLSPAESVSCLVYTILFGGIISIFCILKRHNLWSRLAYFKAYISDYVVTKQWKPYLNKEQRDSYFYFSIPVFLSTICYLGGIY